MRCYMGDRTANVIGIKGKLIFFFHANLFDRSVLASMQSTRSDAIKRSTLEGAGVS